MTSKVFKKYRYDIALQDGVGAHMVSWITGLMVFFMTLTLAVNIGLAGVAQQWVSGLSGNVTVEVPPPMPENGATNISDAQQKAYDEKIKKILWLTQQHPSVEEGRALPASEVKGLIQPWLGDKISDDLPLPALIDIRLATGADVAKLKKDIQDLVSEATVDTHDAMLDDVNTLVNTVRGFVLLLTGVIMVIAIVAISGIVRAKLSIHRPEVETLHLLGADNEYIARQFRHHTLRGTLKGALIGVVAMIVTLLVIGNVTHTIDSAIMPHLRLLPLHWVGLILLPVAAGAVIAHITAQATVLRVLSRMP